MKRIVAALFVAALLTGRTWGQDNKVKAEDLVKRAEEAIVAGDKDAACAHSLAALESDPENGRAFPIAQMYCHKAKLPGKIKAKFKPRKDAAPDSSPGAPLPPEAARPGPAPASAPALLEQAPQEQSAPPPANSGDEDAGVVVPEKPPPVDVKVESSAQMTAQAGERLEAGDAREAIRLATEALEINPSNPRAYLTRGVAYRLKRQWRSALKDAEEGLKLRPNDLNLLKLKAAALNGMKDYQGALDTAESLITINPTDARAYALKACALKGLGDLEGMFDNLRKAAAMDPSLESILPSAETYKNNPDVCFLFPGESPPEGKDKRPDDPAAAQTRRIALAVGFALITFIGIMIGISQFAKSRATPD